MSYNNDNDDNITKKLEVKLTLTKNNNESQLNEPGASEGYLNEKNINEDNTIVDSDPKVKRTSNKRPASPNDDDSLSDFKLPKLTSKPYLSDNKTKLSIVKSSTSSSLRGGKKRGVNRKKPIDKTNQSLLFQSPVNYRCPLCLKSFNDINIQTTHTKNCAAINNVSTEKLLVAAELHERQAEERLAIGLPAAPYQQPRKKSFNIKKMNSVDDPDIQLAIALSRSLSEIEERENFDEALALAAESNENLLQMSSTQRKSTLQNFGFITNKQPIVESTIDKPRRRKNIGPTILQTRTQETRERLLSDKIAEILVGNEGIMQTQLREDKFNLENNIDSVSLQSCILKQMHEGNNKLWNQSSEIKKHTTYYVEDLSEFISPVVELTKIKLNDKNDENEKEIEDNSENKMDIVEELENKSSDLKLNLEKKNDFKGENNSLALSWSKMINSNAYSDIIIHVKNNRYIYCHEIVLWTRCQSILQDVVFNDDKLNNQQRKKINWMDINFPSAIGFLEFIYCGEINNEKMENNRELLIEINDLAKKYKVNELLIYLNEKIDDESKVNEGNKSNDKNIETISQPEVNIINCCNEEINLSNEPKLSMNKSELFAKEISEVNNYSSENIVEKSPNVSRRLQYSGVITSPDMFEETEMFNSPSSNEKKIDNITISQNSSEEALDALVNLVNDNELLNISEEDEMNENINNQLSETPKKYLRLSSTCPDNLINSSKVFKEIKNDNISMLCSTMKRTKSNMSAFIDKVRRKNKKGILDSDSDSEISSQEVQNYRRNPFKVRNLDDDSLLLDKYHQTNLKDDEKLSLEEEKEKKSALTLFEDDIRECLARNRDKFAPFQSQNGSSSEMFEENDNKNEEEESNIFSDAESDDENNQSMYSKYKRTHKNNSIGNYRSILKKLMKESFNEDNGINDNSKEETQINSDNDNENVQLNNTTLNKHEISTVNKIRLAELSAFDIYETLTPNSSSLHSSLEDSEKSKSFSPSKTPIELVELSDAENTDELPINKSLSDKPSEIIKNTSENKSKEINSLECLNQDIEFSNWSDEISEANDWQPLTQSIVKDKSLDENFEVKENEQSDLLNVPLNITDSIDLTQSDDDHEDNLKVSAEKLSISPSHDTITENVTRILKDYGVLDSTALNITSNNEKIIDNLKPIILSSSSETESIADDVNNISDSFNSNAFHENLEEFGIEADFEDNFMQSIIEGGADDLYLTPFGTHIEKPSTSRLCINEENITFRNNPNSFRSQSINNINNDSDDELPEISLKSPAPIRPRCSSVSLHKQKHSTRFLLTKSRSEGNFTSCKSNLNKNNNDNLIIPTNELLLHLNLSSENCEISIDVPPRENYSAMSSPELNKRLAEYGLRNQKHHRAVKLLNYIYNQMHPLVPEYLLNSCRMRDDESLTNDRELSESDGESSDNSSRSNLSEIPEEIMTFSDDEDYTEKDAILLRECFQKLLHNDRVLHNKVLMYEPIPLESTHDKLKNEGIKSGLQLLADYLDDECISFYIENPKKGQRHVRKPKKKKK